MFEFHRFCFRKILVAFGHVEAVKPSLFGGACFIEEQNVGGNACVGRKDAVGQADNRVQVKFVEEFLLDGNFGVVGAE